jgi:co-chaperonin GroES (HSP10)
MHPNQIKTLLKDVVLVELLDQPSQTPSGLFLPETAQPQSTGIQARIMEMGSKFRFKNEVSIGDIIIVPKYFGNALDKDNEKIRMFDGEDVQAIVCR